MAETYDCIAKVFKPFSLCPIAFSPFREVVNRPVDIDRNLFIAIDEIRPGLRGLNQKLRVRRQAVSAFVQVAQPAAFQVRFGLLRQLFQV